MSSPEPAFPLPSPPPPPDPALGAAVEAAAVSLQTPGQGLRRVLSPVAVGELAEQFQQPRWEVEATALDRDIIPLRCLRQMGRLGASQQARLLRSSVVLVGGGPTLTKCVDLLAATGIGRLTVLAPAPSVEFAEAERLAAAARNLNVAMEASAGRLELQQGDPTAALRGHDVCAAALEEMADEMLLQTACRRLEIPVILAGVDGLRGQVTAVLPGDPGIGLVYRPTHPHLEKSRPQSLLRVGKAGLMVGSWLEQQIIAALLGTAELLGGRLLYGDMEEGLMEVFALQ